MQIAFAAIASAVILGCVLPSADAGAVAAKKAPAKPAATFTLWQLPPASERTQLSYVIRTVHGRVIVVDGGSPGDADYLRQFLKKQGYVVDAWFLTHPHDDHFGALQGLRESNDCPKILHFYASLLDEDWVAKHEDVALPTVSAFYKVLRERGPKVTPVSAGEVLQIDGVKVEVLSQANPEICEEDPINNSSVVLRMSDSSKSVLFLGDLGEQGGRKLLAGPYRDRLPSDYVQMAHHGNCGPAKDVYEAIHPNYCLWPTTWWVWDNNNGTGVNTADMHTFMVRKWMVDLHVLRHYVAFHGLAKIQ